MFEGRRRKAYFRSSTGRSPALGVVITRGSYSTLRILLAELARFILRSSPTDSYLDAGRAYFKLRRFFGTMIVFRRLHLLV